MLPSQYTSTYNQQYRDVKDQFISPHPGQEMHHFPGHYDPSHAQRQAGYYGERAQLAETARKTGLISPGFSSSAPLASNTIVNAGYTSREPTSARPYSSGTHTFRTTGFQSLRQTGQVLPSLPTTRTSQHDLWSAPIQPHTGVYSNYTTVPTGVYRDSRYANEIGYNQSGSYSSRGTSRGGYSASQTWNEVGNDWRYDPHGVAQTKNVDKSRNTDPRNKYHIPGYCGFVRGMQFTHGDTYAKTTRTCLDVAIDQPRE